ncbi:smad nuclear-interacting protein 1 [Labrus mixtus]|uniref:smad nuclear-interacting protein 1 n=1 Tax=Labrus mixtus TaxID=508554 RepID=UPI0029C02D06|nr:smad nuclear-interacting protein 1 [Labrus mixtus]
MMTKEKRHRRRESPERESKVKIKQEKLSPERPQTSRRSRSRSAGHSSPPRRRNSRSPVRTRDRSPGRRDTSPGRRGSRSPRNRRSRSPPRGADVKVKREREESRASGDERRRRNNPPEERRSRWESDRPQNTDRDRDHSGDRGRSGDRDRGRSGERDRDRSGDRDRDRSGDRHRGRGAFAAQQAERQQNNQRRRENRQRREENQEEDFGRSEEGDDDSNPAPAEMEKPNFGLSGALTEDTNTFRGVVIKYNEPPEARIPKRRWRLYPFKNDEPLPVMYIHRQSAYLLGRQRKIADIPIDHPSCSKQHAVFQYRLVEFTRADGTSGRRVRPYIIDLGSGNGTYLNNQRIESQRYYELKEKDVIKFGFSSREYVLLHEFSDTAEVDAKQQEDEEDEGLDE